MTKPCNRFFLIFINLNTYVSVIFHAKIQLKMSSGSGEEADFIIFVIFGNVGHLGYSTQPSFILLRTWRQVMFHVKFENCRSSCFIEEDV